MKDSIPTSDEDDTPLNCSCGEPGKPLHSCPYKEDIGGNPFTLCNCCDGCTTNCAMDI